MTSLLKSCILLTKIRIIENKMTNNNQKKAVLARLNKMKYYVRRYGLLNGSRKVLLPTMTAMALNISNIQAQEPKENTDDEFRASSEMPNYGISQNDAKLLAYESKVVYDIDAEVNKRADWFVARFLEAAKKHLDNITKCPNKKEYVKKNFFDVVFPIRNLSGSAPYCITALNRALIDANSIGGDLNDVLPNPNSSECYAANECNAFAAFLQKKGYGDCIDSGKIDFSKLEAGDIILTPRNTKGSKHARQYLGKTDGVHYALNFNIDGIREFKNTSAVVIHMKKLTRKAILRNLEKERLIVNIIGPFDTILPMEQARKIQDFLYRGRSNPSYEDTHSSYLAARTLPVTETLQMAYGKAPAKNEIGQHNHLPPLAATKRREEYASNS